MQSVSSRIWTRVAVFISYDDNNYTTGTSTLFWLRILTKCIEKKARRELHKNASSYIEQILETTSHNQQLYDHLPPISKNIQIRRTRHMGHCWRSKDELTSDVLLWTTSHGRESVGRSTRTYLHQLCTDTVCSLQDMPKGIDDWDE